MIEPITYFITWTTHGSWLPGDDRGWRKMKHGPQTPQPLLEQWCRNRMTEEVVTLNETQRMKVEKVCQEHADHRGWILHAVKARSNHVHVVVTADKSPENCQRPIQSQRDEGITARACCARETKYLDSRWRL